MHERNRYVAFKWSWIMLAELRAALKVRTEGRFSSKRTFELLPGE